MDINEEIIKYIEPDKKNVVNLLKKNKEMWKWICDSYSDESTQDFESYLLMLYLQIVLKDKGIKHFINLFKTTPVNKKIVNKFIYDLLKLSHKADKGLWSWNEIVELHIDIEDWNQSTLSYVFF